MLPYPATKKLFGGVALGDNHLAVCGDDVQPVILGDTSSTGPVQLQGHRDYVNCVSAMQLGSSQFTLLSGSADATVRLWSMDVRDGVSFRCVRTYSGHRGPVRSCCFLDTSGERFASAGGHDDHTVRLWSSKGAVTSRIVSLLGRRGGVLQGHTAPVEHLCTLGDALLASASLDETVRLWDVRAQRGNAVLRGHRREALCLAAHYPLLLSSSDDRTIRAWDVRNGAVAFVLTGAHSSSIYAVEFVPQAPWLCVSGGADGQLAAYDIRTATAAVTAPTAGESPGGRGRRPLYIRRGAHGIRALNKIIAASPPLSLGGAEAAPLWTVGDDGCVRGWRCGAAGFEDATPLNGEAHALLERRNRRVPHDT